MKIILLSTTILLNASSPLVNSGGTTFKFIVAIILVSLLIKAIGNSPKNQKRNADRIDQIKTLSEEDFIDFIKEELCKMFSVNGSKTQDHLIKDLRIPPPEVASTLYDLGVKYDLPISDEDSESVESIQDVVELIQARIKDQKTNQADQKGSSFNNLPEAARGE